jgi:cysteinyl-tRNA synthetase
VAPSWDAFAAALNDDFNTPTALAILHEWRSKGQIELLDRGLSIFGLQAPAEVGPIPDEVKRLADERADARARSDFSRADELRQEIVRLGWEVQDAAEGYRLIPRQ